LSYNLPGIQEKTTNKGITSNTINDFNNQLFVFGELQGEWALPVQQFTLLTNLSFTSKGFTDQGSSGGGYGSFSGGGSYIISNYAHYATVSLLPKYIFTIEDQQLYGFAGPYLSKLIAANFAYYLRYHY